MLKIVFFAESAGLFAQYTQKLEANNIKFWAATAGNDFYRIQGQIYIDILFVDYQLFDHNLFDVRTYAKSFRKDLIILFFNYPKELNKSMLITWQDDLSLFYKDYVSEEIYSLLSILCSEKNYDAKHKVETDNLSENNPLKSNYGSRFSLSSVDKPFTEPINESLFDKPDKNESLCYNNKSLYYFSKLKNRFKIGFSEYILLDLLYAKRNNIVSLKEMLELIWQDNSKSHVNTLYSYVHSLRSFLNDINFPASLIRVKKGFYSLIVEKEIIHEELNI